MGMANGFSNQDVCWRTNITQKFQVTRSTVLLRQLEHASLTMLAECIPLMKMEKLCTTLHLARLVISTLIVQQSPGVVVLGGLSLVRLVFQSSVSKITWMHEGFVTR